ncbi:hypothetical protein [Mycobacterium sp. ACS4331]|uniref:hypothetical protein n=1 Tax=Mycobacterium sp. ACS4331 TaxID=1834121 RepID=UPI000801FCF3|nr:hypothetical protein [Mycobacterium sp. ACS4331]OBF11801.1 hypothetical protein A5727_19470 [Mycobacterium sp. ACS4331]
MTTAEQFRSAVTHPASREVTIAGVPWPAYKVIALVVAAVVFGVVGVATASLGAGVLSGAAVGTVAWVGFGITHRMR